MLINLDWVSMLLGLLSSLPNVVVFLNTGIDKAHISKLFEREGSTWFGKITTGECVMLPRFLNIILVHYLLPTTHKTNDMVHLVASLMEGKALDIPAIMCYMMLNVSSDLGIKRRLPYEMMITQLLEQCGVTFLPDVVVLQKDYPLMMAQSIK